MTDDKRSFIGITVRVSVEDIGCDAESIRHAVQRVVDRWEDGRRSMFVEVALDACQRIVTTALFQLEGGRCCLRDAAACAMDNDTTVSVEPFPTLKTGKYRVLCTASRSEGALGGYELATRQSFATFEEAETYARDISSSRAPLIVVETERASL